MLLILYSLLLVAVTWPIYEFHAYGDDHNYNNQGTKVLGIHQSNHQNHPGVYNQMGNGKVDWSKCCKLPIAWKDTEKKKAAD